MNSSKNFKIKRVFSCDTVVIGGGTTGITAAIASARNGAKTMLIESNGCLGGNSTSIPAWLGFHSCAGELVVKGIPLELLQALQARGGATKFYPDPICGSVTGINPNWWKIVAVEQISKVGVQLLLHSRFVGVEKIDNCIKGIYVFAAEGLVYIQCKFAIDCTDTGLVAIESGETMLRGRESDSKVQASSWVFEIGNINFPDLFDYFLAHPEDLRPFPLKNPLTHIKSIMDCNVFVMGAFSRLITKAKKNGIILERENMPGVAFPNSGRMVSVAVRIADVNTANSINYSNAEQDGAIQAIAWIEFLNKYVPGFGSCELTATPTSIGIRETNHMVGQYVLTADDLLCGRNFDDTIALGGYHLDIHSPDHGGLETKTPPIYSIPYRALLPKNTSNLLLAGRAISASHQAQASTRVIPISMAQGQAVGTAAAILVSDNDVNINIDIEKLQQILCNDGARLK